MISILLTVVGCDNSNQTPAPPNKPFKLPDGSTAYPQGSLATHLDSPGRKKNASLLIWPDPLLGWLLSLRTPQNTQTPKTLFPVSENSKFVLIQVENLPHPEPHIRERRIASFTVLAIEPHIGLNAEQLNTMMIHVNGKPTTIDVDPKVYRPTQATIDSLSQLNPEFADLSALKLRVALNDEVFVTGDYQTLFQIEFKDLSGLIHQDEIEADFMIN